VHESLAYIYAGSSSVQARVKLQKGVWPQLYQNWPSLISALSRLEQTKRVKLELKLKKWYPEREKEMKTYLDFARAERK
jgi:hypothetical protein